MKYLLSLFFLLFFFTTFGQQQFNFQSDPVRNIYNQNLIDSIKGGIITNYDFQIRLWHPGSGALRIPYYDFLCMSNKDNKWTIKCYRFRIIRKENNRVEISERKPLNLNYDSVFIELRSDSLFVIKSLIALDAGRVMKGNDVVVLTEGGDDFFIELLTPTKYRRVQFNSPISFYNETQGRYQEFEKPSKIISILSRIMGFLHP